MTAAQFDTFWRATYPETAPISHFFRHAYPTRWFRIHSLPEARRYATTEAEWTILLNRQNYLLTDLLHPNAPALLVTGDYVHQGVASSAPSAAGGLANLLFTATERLDLHQLSPAEYDPGQYYQPRFSEQLWKAKQYDPLLREMATDQTRAFFVSQRHACLVAPYDGGVDVVLADEATRDYYRERYRAWLSARPDGM